MITQGQVEQKPPRAKSTRIDYLDGIRGLAALAVVLLHTAEMYGLANYLHGYPVDALLGEGLFARVFRFVYSYGLKWGVYAVQIFIVLSGYTLMLSVVHSADGRPKGGLKGYFTRRIRRIWPPYYASLVLALLLTALVPGMATESRGLWTLALPAFDLNAIVPHLLFIQNWTDAWYFKINPPLWTIAVEEQIYILFPLLLLPFWRRFGSAAMVGIAALFGIGTVLLFPQVFGRATLWFLVLFALGAAGATISFSPGKVNEALRQRAPWLAAGTAILLAFFALKIATELGYIQLFTPERGWLEHIFLGVGAACLLINFTERWRSGEALPRFSLLRLLRAAPVVRLGIFSYSLYLVHAPILAALAIVGRDFLGLYGVSAYLFIFMIGVPAALVGAYAFHRVFERPFMPQNARSTRSATQEALPAVPLSARDRYWLVRGRLRQIRRSYRHRLEF